MIEEGVQDSDKSGKGVCLNKRHDYVAQRCMKAGMNVRVTKSLIMVA